ncbi:hypothetical protein HK101_006907 [Irineochytrium annulatum]|nr:hypothetical protein HK101_006907 [Irineochytrium annulatum]
MSANYPISVLNDHQKYAAATTLHDTAMTMPLSPPATPALRVASACLTSTPRALLPDTPQDHALDAPFDPNEIKARRAIRHAIRNNSPLTDTYHIRSCIGHGSNGAVLSASLYTNPSTRVAIKLIYRTSNPPNTRSGYPREVEILHECSRAPYRNVLRMHSCWADSALFYVVTDLHADPALEAASLPVSHLDFIDASNRPRRVPFSSTTADLWTWSLNRSQLPPDSNTPEFTLPHIGYKLNPPPLPLVREIFAQVASGLAHLHANDIAHGDVKEENVLIVENADGTGEVHARLADMGHAVNVVEDGPGTTGYGTEDMTPPELLGNLRRKRRGESRRGRVVDVAGAMSCDVFALAMMLFAILHGPSVLPQAVRETVELGWALEEVMEVCGEYPLGPIRGDADDALRDLLRGMTMVDPAQRFDMDMVMAHPWVTGNY